MKKHILIIFICLINSLILAQKKDFLIEYKFNFTNDSLNSSEKLTELMVIRVYDNGFVFLPKNIFRDDTIKGDFTTYMKNGIVDVNEMYKKNGKTHHRLKLFYNKNENKYFTQANVSFTAIDFEDSVPNISWKLVDEEKEINGYKVKKATTNLFGRKWDAWYTEEIPISYGPYKFYGLPGLILNIKDSQDLFSFEFVNIAKSNSSIPKPFEIGRTKMTRNEFLDYIKKYKENPFIVLNGRKSLVKDDEEFLKRKKALLELNNNSIERGLQFNLK